MSETSSARRVLHLVIEGFSADRLEAIAASSPATNSTTEILRLTESTADEALEKIFAADAVMVWGEVI